MRCIVHASAGAFLDRSLVWLLEREAENNLILGIALSRRDGDPTDEEPAWFATVEERGEILGAAFRTPPHMLGLTDLPSDAVPLLARMVGQDFSRVPGVVGPDGPAAAFAGVWCADRDLRPRTEMRMGIYLLDRLVPGDRFVPGEMRAAGGEDRDMLVEWMEGFERDTGIFSTGADATVDRLLDAGALRVWEVEGTPVSMAGASGATPNGVRVGYVYTPPELRGKGYARAVTEALTRALLNRGYRFCFLYADLTDPVATGIYLRMGYRRVSTAVSIRFDPRESEPDGPGAQA